jgi:anaerobic ribonucleoside-triphosphate reductase activating protein
VNCQNPITWSPSGGLPFGIEEFKEITGELRKEYISGITFSGGDPLHPANRVEVKQLMKFVRDNFQGKTIWVYTGYTWEEIMATPDLADMMKYVDVLVDGKFIEKLKDVTYPWAGSTNQRVISVQESLGEGRVVLHESH